MQQIVNSVYAPLFQKSGNIRYVILMGGRGAGRSTVASQYALAKLRAPEYFRCAIMRYILGDIRNSIYREITDRIAENDLNEITINDGPMALSYMHNSINAVGFRKSSGDQKSKLKSLANYTTVIIEEADEIPEEDFMQLDDSLRTIKSEITIVLLLNPPPRTHWIIRRWFNLAPSEAPGFYQPTLDQKHTDTVFIHTTYLNNLTNISEQTRRRYEEYKATKPDHFYNMICGLVPEVVKGKIYSNWKLIEAIPHEARLKARWLDFGYSNDPTSIGDVYEYNGGYILDEIVYQKGLQNHHIAAILKGQPTQVPVIADSSEPKSIADLRMHGCTIIPAVKGKDSIKYGIDIVQSVPISITRRSINTIEEHENYAWYEDKDGTRLNEPKPGYDHSMDGIRYVIMWLRPASSQPKQYTPIIEEVSNSLIGI